MTMSSSPVAYSPVNASEVVADVPNDNRDEEEEQEKEGCCKLWNIVNSWVEEQCKTYEAEINVLTAFTPLGSHTTDFSTDVVTAEGYLSDDDYWWGSLMVFCTILPMILGGFFRSAIPFHVLVKNFVNSIRNYPNNTLSEEDNRKLQTVIGINVVGETLPMSLVQSYVVSQFIRTGRSIATIQWLSLGISFTALAYGVVTNNKLFKYAKTSSKVIFGFTSLTALCARMCVCAVYGVYASFMWFIPLSFMVLVTVLAWATIAYCQNIALGCYPIQNDKMCSIDMLDVIKIWTVTALMNSVTVSGLVVSSVTVILSLGGLTLHMPQPISLSLNMPQPIIITAFALSCASWLINLIMALSPCCQTLRNEWRSNTKDDKTCILY